MLLLRYFHLLRRAVLIRQIHRHWPARCVGLLHYHAYPEILKTLLYPILILFTEYKLQKRQLYKEPRKLWEKQFQTQFP